MVGPHGTHRVEHPARLDLEAHPGRAGLHHGRRTSCAQRGRGRARRGSRRRRRPPAPRTPRRRRGRPPAIVPSARSSASATAISKVAASMRSTGVPPKSWATSAVVGSSPPRAARPRAGGGTPRSSAACSTRCEGRVDRRALGEGGALAPALGLLGDHPHEEQGADPVHAGGGADGLAEREVDPDELDAGQSSARQRALPHRHRRCAACTIKRSRPDGGMADAAASKASVRKGVRVRVPLRAPTGRCDASADRKGSGQTWSWAPSGKEPLTHTQPAWLGASALCPSGSAPTITRSGDFGPASGSG